MEHRRQVRNRVREKDRAIAVLSIPGISSREIDVLLPILSERPVMSMKKGLQFGHCLPEEGKWADFPLSRVKMPLFSGKKDGKRWRKALAPAYGLWYNLYDRSSRYGQSGVRPALLFEKN